MNIAEIYERAEDAVKGISGPDAAILGADCLALMGELKKTEDREWWRERAFEALRRHAVLNTKLEQLKAEALRDDSDYGMGILHAVSTILAALQDLEDGTTPAPAIEEG